jgi:hypothetical protein
MKTIFFACICLLPLTVFCQLTIPYSTDFNSGVPAGWSADSLWTYKSLGGISNSGVMHSNDPKYISSLSPLFSPSFTLNGTHSPSLKFSVVLCNYIIADPLLTVSCNYGNGWVGLFECTGTTNGENFWFRIYLTPKDTAIKSYAIETIDSATWVPNDTTPYTMFEIGLDSLKNHSSIQFKFEVRCYYRGEVFLDNVSIVDTSSVDNIVAGITNTDWVVYPNPFSDYIILKTNTPIIRWSIWNSLGQEVLYKEGTDHGEKIKGECNSPLSVPTAKS